VRAIDHIDHLEAATTTQQHVEIFVGDHLDLVVAVSDGDDGGYLHAIRLLDDR
jgi:hypothetical protein